MKKIWGLMLSLSLCAALSACGGSPAGSREAARSPASPAASGTAGADRDGDRPERIYAAYAAALEKLLEDHVLPDGTECGWEEPDDLSLNQFAVYDVDRDGREELILLYTNTFAAGMAGYVFACDGETGALRTELLEFPMLTFYDNGTVTAGWSHNQGLAGEFWPFSLYRYDGDSDSYRLAGMVDAWDRSFAETDSQGNPFPEEADTSGTGIVYYLMSGGEYDAGRPVDAAVYTAWIDGYIGAAKELPIPYLPLTEEQIRQIGEGR